MSQASACLRCHSAATAINWLNCQRFVIKPSSQWSVDHTVIGIDGNCPYNLSVPIAIDVRSLPITLPLLLLFFLSFFLFVDVFLYFFWNLVSNLGTWWVSIEDCFDLWVLNRHYYAWLSVQDCNGMSALMPKNALTFLLARVLANKLHNSILNVGLLWYSLLWKALVQNQPVAYSIVSVGVFQWPSLSWSR